MIDAGALIPAQARVWVAPGVEPEPLAEAISGSGLALVCFYPFDWSSGCRNSMLILKERRDDLEAAGIRAFGISMDSPWSQRAFAESLGVQGIVTLLSDRLGEVARGFDVLGELKGLPHADRSAFLVRSGLVVAAWVGMPDVDDVLALS